MIVHLHRFEELSFAEIGRVLGVSEGAARVRAFRAYARLREQLLPAPKESSP
jgi:RNA polymerase sigma-70 factor (ECF subfamily)